MGYVAVVVRRPKPGFEADLRRVVVDEHYGFLHARGYVTDRRPFLLHAAGGEILEIFEWKSCESLKAALADPDIQALQARLASMCEVAPLASLPEAKERVAHFGSIEG